MLLDPEDGHVMPEEQVPELLDPLGPGVSGHLPTSPTDVPGCFPFQDEDRLGAPLASPQVATGHIPAWYSEQSHEILIALPLRHGVPPLSWTGEQRVSPFRCSGNCF